MQETPRVNEALDEYYAHLESTYGMTRHVLRTDYRFADVPTAVRLMGLFFGDSMVRQINARGVPEVPECTGMWSLRPPKIESDKADKPESSEKLAATITPPVKPSMASSHLREALPKKKTSEAPAAVTNQVKLVAMNAARIGSMEANQSMMVFMDRWGSDGFYLQVVANILAKAEG